MLAATEDVLALDIPYGRDEPGIQPWALLRAEALTSARRLAEAAALLDQVDERVGDEDQTTTRVGATRIRALLAAVDGQPHEAAVALEQALGLAAGHEVAALERALLHLDYGAVLRRAGRRRAAAEQLVLARDLLAALGAAPFLERAERELAACGLARGGPHHDVRSLLSPQEQAVATLVATGLTNRQVAERLVLSTKGVEYHLGHVFTKLGVATRTELAARLAPPGRPMPPPH
jgi:ATP/maltotriose-dependent transcriptional regulator MalT